MVQQHTDSTGQTEPVSDGLIDIGVELPEHEALAMAEVEDMIHLRDNRFIDVTGQASKPLTLVLLN